MHPRWTAGMTKLEDVFTSFETLFFQPQLFGHDVSRWERPQMDSVLLVSHEPTEQVSWLERVPSKQHTCK